MTRYRASKSRVAGDYIVSTPPPSGSAMRIIARCQSKEGAEMVADALNNHRGAVDAAEKATALAERYGEAIVAIDAALPNVNRVRAIIVGLDSERGQYERGSHAEAARRTIEGP